TLGAPLCFVVNSNVRLRAEPLQGPIPAAPVHHQDLIVPRANKLPHLLDEKADKKVGVIGNRYDGDRVQHVLTAPVRFCPSIVSTCTISAHCSPSDRSGVSLSDRESPRMNKRSGSDGNVLRDSVLLRSSGLVETASCAC